MSSKVQDRRLPPDADSRAMALDTNRSFIVQAPAGSGKTELLIQRFLALLATVDEPEQVVALTFTRKAAAEMRARVIDAIVRADEAVPVSDPHERQTRDLATRVLSRDRAAGWGLANTPGRLRIQTIDSLFAYLVRRAPILSRSGGVPRMLDDATDLYREAARNTLALLDGDDEQFSASVARLLSHLDNQLDVAEDAIASMLARRDQWLRYGASRPPREELELSLQRARADAIEELRGRAVDIEDRLVSVAGFAAFNLPVGTNSRIKACAGMSALPDATDEGIAQWLGIREMMMTNDGRWRAKPNASQGFPPPSKATKEEKGELQRMQQEFAALVQEAEQCGLRDLLVDLDQLPAPRYTDEQWEVLDAAIDVSKIAAAMLKATFGKEGASDFIEVASDALYAIGTSDAPTELLLSMDERISHLLVDEFQDTSVTQFSLLERLTADWSDGDGRTMFAVGDPMQSIYRFRQAEVGLFLRARLAGIGGITLTPLQLTANFRSNANVVEWTNAAFSKVFPQVEDMTVGAVAFSESAAWKPRGPGVAVRLHPLAGDDSSSREATLVTTLAQQAHLPSQRDGRPSSVAILVRNRAHLIDIVPKLRAAGLPIAAVEIAPLAQQPVVSDLRAITRALAHPADRVAWLAVLRSPSVGMTLQDLVTLTAGDNTALVWDLIRDQGRVEMMTDDGRRRVDRFVTAFGPAVDSRRRGSIASQVEAAWIRLGGPASTTDKADLEDARSYLDLLASIEAAGTVDLELLDNKMTRLYANPRDSADAIQVMTIHKSKGLEFDAVIIPGMGRGGGTDVPPLFAAAEIARPDGSQDVLLGAMRGRHVQADTNNRGTPHGYILSLERKRAKMELARLMYVASTRARRELHLIGSVTLDASTEDAIPKPPRQDSLLGAIWPAAQMEVARRVAVEGRESLPLEGQAGQPGASEFDQELRRLPSAWRPPALPPSIPVIDRRPAHTQPEAIDFEWAGEGARLAGTVVHAYLQKMAGALDQWSQQRVREEGHAIRQRLMFMGLIGGELDSASSRVEKALRNALTDPRARWIIGQQGDNDVSEFRVTAEAVGQAGAIVDVAIDRLIVRDGVRWIVDYKTGAHEGGGLGAFLDAEMERYRPQLDRYARVVADLYDDGLPTRCALYFPLLGQWKDWDPAVQLSRPASSRIAAPRLA